MRTRETRQSPPCFVRLARAYPRLTVVVILALCGAVYAAFTLLYPGETYGVRRALGGLRDAVVKGDPVETLEHISPHFSQEGMDRRQLGRRVAGALSRRSVSRAELMIRRVNIEDGVARVRLRVSSVHGGALRGGRASSEWLVELDKMGDRWLVSRAEPLRVNHHNVSGLRAVLAMGGSGRCY
ncbi:MAG: hypothetical protein J7M08_10380 [Planctomycetes bacterium]|nr:hypothetical protein [Planctomycetota bacterium]